MRFGTDVCLHFCRSSKLLLARYIDESANVDAESVPKFYTEARSLSTGSEEVLYHSAKFFDKVMLLSHSKPVIKTSVFCCLSLATSTPLLQLIGKNYNESDLDTRGEMIYHVMNQYGRSLIYGCNNIHQSLARMFTLWFDYGSRLVSVTT